MGRLRRRRPPRTWRARPHARRRGTGFRPLLSARARPATHALDAPALRTRHCLHRRVRPSGLVCAPWIQRRHSRRSRPRRFRRRFLSLSQRGRRRRRYHRLAAHAARIKRPRWNVRLLLSGDDATPGCGRTARRLAVHLARDDGVRPVSRLVLSRGSVASRVHCWAGDCNC